MNTSESSKGVTDVGRDEQIGPTGSWGAAGKALAGLRKGSGLGGGASCLRGWGGRWEGLCGPGSVDVKVVCLEPTGPGRSASQLCHSPCPGFSVKLG